MYLLYTNLLTDITLTSHLFILYPACLREVITVQSLPFILVLCFECGFNFVSFSLSTGLYISDPICTSLLMVYSLMIQLLNFNNNG